MVVVNHQKCLSHSDRHSFAESIITQGRRTAKGLHQTGAAISNRKLTIITGAEPNVPNRATNVALTTMLL